MTGIVNYNRDAFFEAEEFLQNLGHETVNPARLTSPTGIYGKNKREQWVEYMKRDIISMLLFCNSIVMLDGWEKSDGARIEYDLSVKLGFIIFKSLDDVKQASLAEIRQAGMEPAIDQPCHKRT